MKNDTNPNPRKPIKRKRGRPSLNSEIQVVPEQAAAYGVALPPAPTEVERFLSPNDIGKILNVTGMAVKQWLYRGKLPGVRLANGFWKVRVEDFEAYLQSRTAVHKGVALITDSLNMGTDDIKNAAEECGLKTLVANNYSDALLKALEHFPAVFVINCSPKDSDCWKFADRIRSTKALRSLPILLVAGKAITEEQADRAVACNAQGLLSRPLENGTLTREIERILERNRV